MILRHGEVKLRGLMEEGAYRTCTFRGVIFDGSGWGRLIQSVSGLHTYISSGINTVKLRPRRLTCRSDGLLLSASSFSLCLGGAENTAEAIVGFDAETIWRW